jgi:hypothetical protein
MVVQTAELIFNDTPSRYNKDLTDFLDRNIELIITKGQIKFRFKIAKAANISSLRAKGIKRLPAMILGKRPYIGVPVIVEELRKRVRCSKSSAAPKSEEEVLDDFFKQTLGDIQHDDEGKHIIPQDNEMDDEVDLGNLFNEEMKRRNDGDSDGKRQGGNTGKRQGANRRGPPKPDRLAIQDDDDYEDRAPPRRPPPRLNNIDTATAGDPLATLNNMRSTSGKQSPDDDMLQTLLERMGGDGGFDI